MKNSEKTAVANEDLEPTVKTTELIVESEEIEEVTDENFTEDLKDESINEPAIEESEEPITDIPIMEKQTILSPSSAKRLIFSVTKGLIPQLHKSLASKMRFEGSHKENKKRVSNELEEEELMRIPIALAMVKLLQKLPEKILDLNLRG